MNLDLLKNITSSYPFHFVYGGSLLTLLTYLSKTVSTKYAGIVSGMPVIGFMAVFFL
jgi:hypothetical protein